MMANRTLVRRVMALTLAFALVCSMVPTQALAATNTVTIKQGETGEWALDSGTSGTIVSGAQNGTAEIKDGKLVYTPDAGFTGTDTVTLTETKDITLSAAVKDDAPQATLEFGDTNKIKAGETVTGTLGATWGADGAAAKDAITVNGVSGTDDGTNITFSTDYGTFSVLSADYSAGKENLSVSFTAKSDLTDIEKIDLAVTCTDGDGSTATAEKSFTVEPTDPNTPTLTISAASGTVDEEDLSWGSGVNKYPNSNTYSGTFTFDCYRDGNTDRTLTIGGKRTYTIDETNSATINTRRNQQYIYSNSSENNSSWKITINSIENGTVSYTYELLQNRTHNSTNADYDAATDTVLDTIAVTASATSNGETLSATANLTFNITDDAPIGNLSSFVGDSRLPENCIYGNNSYTITSHLLGADVPQSTSDPTLTNLVKVNGQTYSSATGGFTDKNLVLRFDLSSPFSSFNYYPYGNETQDGSLVMATFYTEYVYTLTKTKLEFEFTDTDGDTATDSEDLNVLYAHSPVIDIVKGKNTDSVAADSSISGSFVVRYVAGETVTLTAGDNQVSINANGSGSGAFPISCHSEEGYGEFKITSVTSTTTDDGGSNVVSSEVSYTYTPDASAAGKTDTINFTATSEYGRTYVNDGEHPNSLIFNITSASGGASTASLSAAALGAADDVTDAAQEGDDGAAAEAADDGTDTAAQEGDDGVDAASVQESDDSAVVGFSLIQAAYAAELSDEDATDSSVVVQSDAASSSLTTQSTMPDFTVYEAGLTASTGQSAGSHAGEDAYPTTATYTLSSEYTSDGWQIASVEAKGSKGYGTAAKKSDTEVAYTLSGAQTHTNGADLTEDVTVTLSKTVTVTFDVIKATYTITSSAGEGGSISPDGSTTVESGGSQTYTITAADGYKISDVYVDGESAGAVASYTFENVNASHTIRAEFEKEDTPSPTPEPSDGGSSTTTTSSTKLASTGDEAVPLAAATLALAGAALAAVALLRRMQRKQS